MNKGQQVRRSASSGFTLLELTLAFTILGLMAGLIFSSLRMSLNSYEKSQERLDVAARERVLQDLIKRQIGSLQRQAGKARRYKTLALDLEHLDTQLARHQFDTLQAQIGERIR